MPRSPKPSIVVFDIGGVLIDWNPRYLYRKLFAEDTTAMEEFLNSVCTPDWNLQQDAGRPWKEAVDDLSDRYPEKAELIAAYDLNWDEMVSGPIPGTADLLWELKRRGTPVYCITNFSVDKLNRARERFEELNAFDGIVVSGEVRLLKPDAAIYRRLLDQHDLRAEDTLFIDDVEQNVEGARTVGMHAVRFVDAETLRNDLTGYGLL
jgi:2-haloacid dehalogenase